MSNFINEDFSFPEGYSKEKIEGDLCCEDIDEDSELWLIRVPSEVQLSDLDRKKIYLGRNSNDVNSTSITTESGKILECVADSSESQNMCVLMPERNSKKLQLVRKGFKGTIFILPELRDTNDLDEVKTGNAEDSCVIIDDGTSSPHISKRRKKNKTSHNPDVKYQEEIIGNSDFSTRKFGRSSKCSEVSNIYKEKAKIKTEPELRDLEEFPFCESQN